MSLPDLANVGWKSSPPDQAASLRPESQHNVQIENLTAVVSGKGGVGKTNVVANVAVAAAGLGARVLVVDGDMGLSNLDVLLGLSPKLNVVDVMSGRCSLREALVEGPKGIEVLPAGSGRHDLEVFERGGATRLIELLAANSDAYDFVLIDAGAGIGNVVVRLASAASRVLLVAVPEPTSFADAYAMCKTLWHEHPELSIETLVNCSENLREGREVHDHLDAICERFLGKRLILRAVLSRDRRLREAVVMQRAVVEAFPNSDISASFIALAQGMWGERLRRSAAYSAAGKRSRIDALSHRQTRNREPRKGDVTGNL